MCGICGIYGTKAAESKTVEMTYQLGHRGPDNFSSWTAKNISIGHSRLSIVDLSDAGSQPICNDMYGLVAVVNGEIYNYASLRKKLENLGARFRSNTDSEVVLHAFAFWGEASFERLNGMFAFALFDVAKNELYLVRDRVGIKPLYYMKSGEDLFFASEIKAILKVAGNDNWKINHQSFLEYLTYQNYFNSETLFENIVLVKPGSFLKFDGRKCVECTYFQRPNTEIYEITSFGEAVDQFKKAFSSSVERHLMADVSISTYLSSGYDSGIVTAQAKLIDDNISSSFTGSFNEGPWYDESFGADIISKHIGVENHKVPITASSFASTVDEVIHALDGPRMGIGAVSQYLVASKAAEHSRVILTGHGGDELFSGYPVYKFANMLASFEQRPLSLVNQLRGLKPTEFANLLYFALGTISSHERKYFLPVLQSLNQLRDILSDRAKRHLGDFQLTNSLQQLRAKTDSPNSYVSKLYMEEYLHGLLIIEDKVSMAHSLESRTPFLDNELVSLSNTIHPDVKLHGGLLKAVIKALGSELLPKEIKEFPKRGFPTPLRIWLRGPLKKWAEARILSENCSLESIFCKNKIHALWQGYQLSSMRHVRPLDEIQTFKIWQLISLESWLRQLRCRYGINMYL